VGAEAVQLVECRIEVRPGRRRWSVSGNGAIGSGSDQQRPNRDAQQRDRSPEIKTGDLAKFEVTSAAIVGEACGGNVGRETSGKTSGVPNTDREPRSNR